MLIGVVGVGYVGGATALGLGHWHKVLVYDPLKSQKDTEKFWLENLNELPNLNNRKNIEFVDALAELSKADLIMLCLPTPAGEDGQADLSIVNEVIRQISEQISSGDIVIRSTIPPGTTDYYQNKYPQYRFAHNPEFLKEKTPLHDFLYPSRIVIGSNSQSSTNKLKEAYAPLGAPVITMTPVESELTKYAANSYLAVKISYHNEIGELARKLGANPRKIELGVGLDPRIGNYGIKSGKSFGGSCLPKDTKAIVHFAKKSDKRLKIIETAIEANEALKEKEK